MKFRLASLLAAIGMCLSTAAAAQTPVKMSTDFRISSANGGFLIALDKGYYKEEGLDVTIDAGNGSVEGINRVASGSYDISVADINSLIRYRDNPQNPPIKAVMMIGNVPAFSVVSLKKTGIEKPKDLEGRLVGAPAADGAYANWAAFIKASGIDTSKIRIENVGFPVREPMLAQGRVDAIVGFSYSAVVALANSGLKREDISVMFMRDYGLDLYGNALLASPSLMRDNPEVLRKFIRASIRGWKDMLANPEMSIAAVLKRNPVSTPESEKLLLSMFMNDNFLTPEVKANGIGYVDSARFNRAIDQIGESFDYKNKPKMNDVYTEAFLPPAAERKLPATLANKKF